MVSTNGDDQSQDVLDLAAALDGGNSSQQVVFDNDQESGAGDERREPKTPKPRTYSEEEMRAVQSASDQKNAQLANTASQAILIVNRERAQRLEDNALRSDSDEVDNGDLSAEGAQLRANQRNQTRNANAQTAQANAATQQANSAVEPVLRHAYALELAEEHKIDIKLLEEDQSIVSPEQMMIKARELVLDKREKALNGPEVFDRGVSGSGTGNISVNDMNGVEKVAYALGRPAPKKT